MYTQIEGDKAIFIQTLNIHGEAQQNIQVDMHVASQTSEYHFRAEPEPTWIAVSEEGELPFEPLTDRELEVAQLIMEGYLTKQVALALHIAIGTVRNHVKNIYQKLEVHSRVQLINKLIQYNLVDTSELV